MSNIKLLTFILLLMNSCYAQDCTQHDTNTFLTYSDKQIPSHQLILCDKQIELTIYPQGLRYGDTYTFDLEKNNDLLRLKLVIDTTYQEGVKVEDEWIENIIDQFNNKTIKIISEKELLLIDEQRPYVQERIVDSLLGKNTIYCVNGKICKIPEDYPDTSELYKLINKPKKAKVQILSGKEAYKRYGIIGFNGVVEIKDKE
ncbi:MAG: hypothetical protein CR968_06210 [Flavobacteriia bacterium]|nr:MAG: hypothetical protein CR968_06210 [Flavobacteriia bacterium]